VKLYDDLYEQNNNDKMVARWCEILEFWNSMSTAEQYKEVDKGVFKEKTHRREARKGKRPSRPIAELLSFDEEDVHLIFLSIFIYVSFRGFLT
jgi:hypothetical protein